MITFYKGNSQFIKFAGFKDNSTTPATYINNATLTATLHQTNRGGEAVPGATDMAGQYQIGSNGEYRFAVDPTQFDPIPGKYLLKISGSDPGGDVYEAEEMVQVAIRDFES